MNRDFDEFLAIGEHIFVERQGVVNYSHHAIYVGKNRVIHYTGPDKRASSIQETDIGVFIGLDGSKIWRKNHAHPKFSPEEVVNRARAKIGTANYALFGQNCEHFASWCVTGDGTSQQVATAGFWIFLGGVLTCIGGLALTIASGGRKF